MKGKNLTGLLILTALALVLSGCVARTYSLTRERVDQDLTSGNQGYIIGKAPAEESNATRKTNRTVRVFEIEIGKPYQVKQGNIPVSAATGTEAVTPEAGIQELPIEEAAMETVVSQTGQKYTVGKNDTLQKISQKFYGTTKKWMKIYEANKDVLKGPNKVYPGQVLTIPGLPESSQGLKEPKENLK